MPTAFRGALGSLLIFVTLLSAAAPPGSADAARVTVLIRKLDADSFQIRQRADTALRAMGKSVVPVLKVELERTKSFEVRWRLGRIVHDLTIDERIGDLVRMLGHDNTQFRDQADHALRKAGGTVVPLLRREIQGKLNAQSRKRLEKIIADLSTQTH